jgi:hypothetical protein
MIEINWNQLKLLSFELEKIRGIISINLSRPTKSNPSLPRSVGCKRQFWRLRWALVGVLGLVTRDTFYNDSENNNRRTHSGQQSLVSSPAYEDFTEIYAYDKAVTRLWQCNDDSNKKPKTKTKNTPQGHHNIHLQRSHPQKTWQTTPTHKGWARSPDSTCIMNFSLLKRMFKNLSLC